jgi:ligand-binding sensor domain-containing protein
MNRSFFLLFLLPFCLLGQVNDFHFKQLSTADGLSNSSVIAIEQDKHGNMWFGTRNGLNKYNGDKFTIYRNDPNNSGSLTNSDILSILEDSNGDLWIGTYHGLNKYDPVKNTFTQYLYEGATNSLCNNVVICSKEMPNGEIWFGTANGISIYSRIKDEFTNIPYIENSITGLPYKNIQRIFLDSSNQVWVATSGGLAKLISRNKKEFIFKQFKRTKKSQNLFIQDVIEIKTNVLALATKYNGLIFFNTIDEEFITDTYPDISSSSDVRVLELANDGNLWLGTTHGVQVISPDSKVYSITSNRYNIAGLSQNFIKSIFKDNNGSIWLGTYSDGANIWNEANENFINFKNNAFDNNVVTSIISDNSSTLYIGTEEGYITVLDAQSNTSEIIEISGDEQVNSLAIQSLLLSESNLLWVGVLNYGVFVYDIQTKKKLNNIIPNELKTYLQNTGVYVIQQESNGVYWFGTFGKGLVRYNSVDQTFRVFGLTMGEDPHLSTNIIKNDIN